MLGQSVLLPFRNPSRRGATPRSHDVRGYPVRSWGHNIHHSEQRGNIGTKTFSKMITEVVQDLLLAAINMGASEKTCPIRDKQLKNIKICERMGRWRRRACRAVFLEKIVYLSQSEEDRKRAVALFYPDPESGS